MQKYTSANTSINKTKLPILFKKLNEMGIHNTLIIDVGCGKFIDHIKDYVSNMDCSYLPYDKYNQSEEVNEFSKNGNDVNNIVTLSNVLNVIAEKEERINLVKEWLKPTVTMYISIYEGNRSGISRVTKKDCHQMNQRKQYYVDELKEIANVEIVKEILKVVHK